MTRETVVRTAEWSSFVGGGEDEPQGVFLQSETHAPACSIVLDAMRETGSAHQPAYGNDNMTAAVQARLSELFETEVSIWFTSSATAANALIMSAFCRPTSSVLCGASSAVFWGASVPFYCGGAPLVPIPTVHGKITVSALNNVLHHVDRVSPRATPPDVLSLSNLTEAGTAYSPSEIAELAGLARSAGLAVHVDGRRFAAAVAAKGASPADLSWRAGVDAMSFGATRNGAMDCEAIILFGKARGRWHDLIAKANRAGHAPARMRYFSVQMEVLLRYDLWLDLARAANIAARRVASVIADVPGADIVHPVDGNMVFARLPDPPLTALMAADCRFGLRDHICRFVCSSSTGEHEIRSLARILSVERRRHQASLVAPAGN